MIELEHSPLGGSSANRFIHCAGSFLLHREQLQSGEFEDVPTEFAELGTGAHELAAACLVSDKEAFDFIGQEFNGYKAGWEDGIKLDAVSVYINECRRIMEICDYDGLAVVEKTYHASALHPLLKGTVDFAYLSPAHGLFLRDYKNGEGVGVGPVNNRQLLYYAFLLLDAEWRHAPNDMRVSLGIVQPNFYGIYEEPEVWETTVGVVLDFGYNVLLPRMNELTKQAAVTDDDFALGDHCQFCPVTLDCPLMRAAFESYAASEEDFIEMLTNQELSDLYGKRDAARRFMKALERTVYARKVTGGDIPSAKLVEKKVARVWRPGAEEAARKKFGEKALSPAELKSPAQIEKLSSIGKEFALEWGYKPQNDNLTIAPLSDPRAEAKPRTNENVFAGHSTPIEEMGW